VVLLSGRLRRIVLHPWRRGETCASEDGGCRRWRWWRWWCWGAIL